MVEDSHVERMKKSCMRTIQTSRGRAQEDSDVGFAGPDLAAKSPRAAVQARIALSPPGVWDHHRGHGCRCAQVL
jgi:hypothetical protein